MAGRMNDDKMVRCSFCGKTQNQVHKLIAGPMERLSAMNGHLHRDHRRRFNGKGLVPEYDEPEQEGKHSDAKKKGK